MDIVKVSVIEGSSEAIIKAGQAVVKDIIGNAELKAQQGQEKCKSCNHTAECKDHAIKVKAAAEKALEGITEFLAVMGELAAADEEEEKTEGGK